MAKLIDGPAFGQQVRDHVAARVAELKRGWGPRVVAMRSWLEREFARKPKRVDVQARFAGPWLDALQAWAGDPAAEEPDLKTGWKRLTREDLVKQTIELQ